MHITCGRSEPQPSAPSRASAQRPFLVATFVPPSGAPFLLDRDCRVVPTGVGAPIGSIASALYALANYTRRDTGFRPALASVCLGLCLSPVVRVRVVAATPFDCMSVEWQVVQWLGRISILLSRSRNRHLGSSLRNTEPVLGVFARVAARVPSMIADGTLSTAAPFAS